MGYYGTEKIAEGIYWVGGNEQNGGLHCNPYLIIDGEEAVLIDPGSVLDFDEIPIKKEEKKDKKLIRTLYLLA